MFGHLITSVFNALSPETHERQHQELVSAIMGYLRANNIPLAVSRHVLQHVRNGVPRPRRCSRDVGWDTTSNRHRRAS